MITTDLEITLYGYYCKQFRAPKTNTTTEKYLKNYCKQIVKDNPNFKYEEIIELISKNWEKIEIIFNMPELPL